MQNRSSGILEKLLGTLVGVVFALVAICVIWLLGTIFTDHQRAAHWVSVPATVIEADLRSTRGGAVSLARAAIHSKVRTTYRYSYDGNEYTGDRVDFGFGSDNFSDRRRTRQLRSLRSDAPTIFVNPDHPAESVLDRSLPVEQINFAVVFLFFPCGLGTILLLGWFTHLVSLAGWVWPSRFLVPAIGLLHSLPAFYAPLFAPADLGPFGWFLFLLAGAISLLSIRSIWRRLKDSTIDAPQWTARWRG